ncbi:MAG: PepSY domain-containing protein [Oscillospiraceae bacterium]|jgi:hypothetical protein|nr:PepSY domain-containing protein [Oscillospiraceae bacterium]
MTREELMHYAPLPEKVHERMMQTAYQVEEETIVKKKMSLALVLALTLVLVAAIAVAAALLSGQQFVEQELVPRVEETDSNQWTKAELDEILRIAEEYGVTLSPEWMAAIEDSDGEYKEAIIRAFLMEDWGVQPGTWRIEDQAWYDELLVSLGLSPVQTSVVPGEGEISEEEVLALAVELSKDMHGQDVDILDETKYRRFVAYQQFEEDGEMQPRRWNIWFDALDQTLYSFYFTFSSQGVMEEARSVAGLRNPGEAATAKTIMSYYQREYGLIREYTQEVWVALQKDLERSVAEHGHQGMLTNMLLQQQYGTPDEASISKEAAIEAARKALIETGVATEAVFLTNNTPGALYLMNGEARVWKVQFVDTDEEDRMTHGMMYAEVDAYTGEVTHAERFTRETPSAYAPYVLSDIIEQIQREGYSHG